MLCSVIVCQNNCIYWVKVQGANICVMFCCFCLLGILSVLSGPSQILFVPSVLFGNRITYAYMLLKWQRTEIMILDD